MVEEQNFVVILSASVLSLCKNESQGPMKLLWGRKSRFHGLIDFGRFEAPKSLTLSGFWGQHHLCLSYFLLCVFIFYFLFKMIRNCRHRKGCVDSLVLLFVYNYKSCHGTYIRLSTAGYWIWRYLT